MGKRNMSGEKITQEEREAIINLPIALFEIYEDESLLNKGYW